METILVTGLSGMVGTRFQALYGENFHLVNLDLTNGVDITNRDAVNRIVGEADAKALIHLAAFMNVSAAHEQKGDTTGVCYRVNVLGTENIAIACRRFDVYLIHVSTDFYF